MAYDNIFFASSFTADSDLSSSQFCAVAVQTDAGVDLPGTAGLPVIGVLQNKPKSGQTGTVAIYGISKVIAGTGNLSAGDLVEADTDGTGITAASGKYAFGIALEDAAAGLPAPVFLLPQGRTA